MPAPIPDPSRDQQCHHYQAPTGQRCGSPALKGEYYCYHHIVKNTARSNHRVLVDPETTRMEVPPIEDKASIFVALAAVIHRLAENTIDTRRAGQMIYGLQIAMRALEPAPAHRSRTSPAAQSVAEAEPAASTNSAPGAPCRQPVVPATSNSQPATPQTIPIAKESLLYFLRSRHCYNCNAELFPAKELSERCNPALLPKSSKNPDPPCPPQTRLQITLLPRSLRTNPALSPPCKPSQKSSPTPQSSFCATRRIYKETTL